MQKSFSTFIKEQLDLECLLCLQQYDSHRKQPLQVCSNHHFFCRQCVTSQRFKRDIRNCPICRQTISERSVKPLQAYIFIEKVKTFSTHLQSNNFDILQKLKKTQDDLKNAQVNLQKVLNNQKRLKQQNVKLQNQIRKLAKQIKTKEESLINQKHKKQQKQSCLLNCKEDVIFLQEALNVRNVNTIKPPNQLQKTSTNCSQQSKNNGNPIDKQNQLQSQKNPCKVCNMKHSVLCFGLVCLKCYKKTKI